MRTLLSSVRLALAGLALSVVLSACEGDPGPMGPQGPAGLDGQDATSAIIAFGSVDAWTDPQNPTVTSFGPGDVAVTVTYVNVGRHLVSISGTFSGEQPVLVVSGSEAATPASNTQVTGDLITWSDSLIEFNVSLWNSQADAYTDDVFSFVLLI